MPLGVPAIAKMHAKASWGPGSAGVEDLGALVPDFSFSSNVDIEGASAAEAFAVYAHLPNHPQWSSLLEEVRDRGLGRSQWSLRVMGLRLSWTSRVVEELPHECIAWESTSGIRNRGMASFTDLPGRGRACRVRVQMRFQTPAFLRAISQSSRLSSMAESALSVDLKRFRDVVLRYTCSGADAEGRGCVMSARSPLTNVTHQDMVGSCSVVLWPDGFIEFRLMGFGNKGTTQHMLDDLSGGIQRLRNGTSCSALIDMTQGLGCSPLAVAPIVGFLQRDGCRIAHTAVLGPRPLVAFARLVAGLARQPGVGFFSDGGAARAWLSERAFR